SGECYCKSDDKSIIDSPSLAGSSIIWRSFRILRSLQQQSREFVRHIEHDVMPALKLLLPPAALGRLEVKLAERTVKATRPNKSNVRDVVAGAAELRGRFKTGQWMHRALTVHPVGVCRVDTEGRCRSRRNFPTVATGLRQFSVTLALIGQIVENGFAVFGNEGVEIDQRANPVGQLVGNMPYDGAAVGGSNQDDVAQVFPDQEIDYIQDMGFETDA